MADDGKKISTLVIRVDLGCTKCYNKIRQVLCKYHCLIISKTFDEKNNTVTITGYFHPCKFSKKLCCKAGKAIISIEEVKPPPPPKPQHPPAAPATETAPVPAVADPPKGIPQPDPPVIPVVVPVQPPTPKAESPKKKTEPDSDSEPEHGPGPQPGTGIPYFIPGCYPLPPPAMPPQFGVCCGPCYQGIGGGPCHHQPPPAPYYQDCYYGKTVQPPPCSCGCGGYRRCSSNPCEYFTDENPNSCNVM